MSVAMEIDDRWLATPDLDMAIERSPLQISPETGVREAIAMMSQARGSSCYFSSDNELEKSLWGNQNPSSCALVMEGGKLLGILTERDIVRLTASEMSFDRLKVSQVMTQPVITLSQENFRDIFAALFLFRRYKIRHLPLVDEKNNLVGVISPETIRHAIRPANLLKLRRVADVMSKNVVHAPKSISVVKITQLMAQQKVSCVVITEEDEIDNILIPVGIITERDIMQFQSLELNLSSITTEEVMSTPLFLISPEDSLLKAHQEMQHRRVRRLVVSWNWGQGLGVITQTSLLRIFDPMEMYGVIKTLQRTIEKLEVENHRLSDIVKNIKG
ncbi:MAG: CBS domain-containing protein [Xenococcaceae cyanobacterium MO_167.B27]|nr:CBS domain-containing protein [Xenococcaceae cyanobacterium MO_167.B27]